MTGRRRVLGGLMVAFALLTMALLWEVVGTVFFALTVAYVLAPVRHRLRDHGLSRRLSALLATAVGFLGVLALAAPLAVVLLVRIDGVISFLETIPETVAIPFRGYEYVIVIEEIAELGVNYLVAAATQVASAIPVLLVKLLLFVFVVYSLLYYEQRTRRAVIALIPPEYRDLGEAFHERARQTLYGIYVVQAATGLATFLIALPVFYLFGYPSPIALATVAGVLQFIPVLGPSLLIGALAIAHVAAGELVMAASIAVIGGLLIAVCPDVFIRPQLAAETANLPASLYFIGFVGGVLTVGPIGVIVGPLAVAIVVEAATQLSNDINLIRVREETQ